MIWLLLVPAVALLIWAVVEWGGCGEGQGMAATFSSIFIVVFIAILISVTFGNGAGLAKWQAFYMANTQNYQIAISQTESYLSEKEFLDKLVDGSLERLQQAGYVSERIAEWRDAINNYNLTLAR